MDDNNSKNSYKGGVDLRGVQIDGGNINVRVNNSRNKVVVSIGATVIVIIAAVIIIVSGGGGGGLPDGRYEPIDESTAFLIPAITIKGNEFSVEMPMGIGANNYKYEYSDGMVTLKDGSGLSGGIPCTYENGVLIYGGMEFKKK
ncbi:MAG: hypothetical protein FWG90_08505 [Oscillospiraceae bacterium]|nr:hypothetical protein [Oscillospiraceae bacterium]